MGLVSRIAYDLNDVKHIAWSSSAIEAWVREAIGLVVKVNPSLFKTRKIVQLDTCTEFQDVACCDYIFNVIGQCTKDGRVIKRLRKSNKWVDTWPVSMCPGHRASGLSRYTIENDKDLYVAPPLGPNDEAYLLVECTAVEDVNESNLPAGIDAAVVMWVMYRARSMDAESSVVADMGEANFQKMQEILNDLKVSTYRPAGTKV